MPSKYLKPRVGKSNCIVCNLPTSHERCTACYEVFRTWGARKDCVLVVDGSYSPNGDSGAGLVLAHEATETVIAYCAASFKALGSNDAEYQAIKRGHLWVRLDPWSDCPGAIRQAWTAGIRAEFIPNGLRKPLHDLAHRLANAARKQEWHELDRLAHI